MNLAAGITMNLPYDCIYEILRRVGPIAAAPCTVVCKQWKQVIFRSRLPILVFDRAGTAIVCGDDSYAKFVAFVRNRRGYTRCVVETSKLTLNSAKYFDVSRGGSSTVYFISGNPGHSLLSVFGDYSVLTECFNEIKATWPIYDELAALLAAACEFSAAPITR